MTGEAPTYRSMIPHTGEPTACSLCSALVDDEVAHTAWHAHLADAISRAFRARARQQGRAVSRTW